jgi:HD-GYP domain-containing protein (c-di-GMP phosphodiesterase class II)
MNGNSSERILVCGTDNQFRTAVEQALGAESGRLDYCDDPGRAIEEAAASDAIMLVDQASARGGLDSFLNALTRGGHAGLPVVIRADSGHTGFSVEDRGTIYYLPREQFPATLPQVLVMASHLAGLKRKVSAVEKELASTDNLLHKLISVGRSLSGHKDVSTLLTAILSESRAATQSDSGSLYLVEEDRASKMKRLRFRIPQNDSIEVSLSNLTLGLDDKSVAGYVAVEGRTLLVQDAYNLPADAPYRFDRAWDEKTKYRSRSMLVVPMKNHKNQVIGVIQLINKKLDPKARLVPADPSTDRVVVPFDVRDVGLVEAIASQASIAVENTTILEDMMRLFDGFVAASARAVECMDSATSGHCERLAQYAVMTAKKINTITEGPLAKYKFDRAALKELRYAALMHDIGKIGVRESVLKKDRRLTEDRLELIKVRFQYFKEVLKHKAFRQAMNTIFSGSGRVVNLTDVEKTLEDQVKELDDILVYILQINTYGRLDDPDYDKLKQIAASELVDVDGKVHSYLTPDEFENLAVRRGNLTPKERLEIEEHVVLTHKILASIPWLPEYKLVPEIAGSHHERIDGSGYPDRLKGDDIPIGGQILAMLDIYEALTASDRPYKPPVSREKALQILEAEAKANHLNQHIVRLFIDEGIYKAVELPAPVQRKEGSTQEAW